jgi:cytochrome c oxidase assembly factor CtaG
MSPTLDAFLRSWPFDPWLAAALLVTGSVYLRGWRVLHRRAARRWHGGHLAAFFGGLAAIYLALASPIEPFAALLLQVHMVQHLLLMMVAPPLLWLGAPLFPLFRGLPPPIRVYWVAPLFRSSFLRRLFERLSHPVLALPLYVSATWLWHTPGIYDLGLRSNGWHYLQHGCFLGTALLFWYSVVRPYPSRPRWSAWLLFPDLILADVQNTVLSALLTFSDRVWYPYYTEVPRLGGLSALEDQAAAGVLMWVPGSLAFLLPLFGIGIRLLGGVPSTEYRVPSTQPAGRPQTGPNSLLLGGTWDSRRRRDKRIPLPLTGSQDSVLGTRYSVPGTGFDLLRVPLLGRFLLWRHARLSLQMPLLVLAIVVIYDGLRGPQVGPMNLAGVLPWIHWRGLVILGLLAAGNVFCLACPFTGPRTLARRLRSYLLPSAFQWPRWLRNKWLAVCLLIGFLWAYEAFALWDSPWWTAWIALGYFVTAFVIDGFFRGAAFCKYVCPLGQFNFVQALVSPLEVKVRAPAVCASCRTKDCLPACELDLFLPRKMGNMDCTACLECVHACPHDNIGIRAGPPGRDLWQDSLRSGVGRFPKRPDLAALILVLVFGAFANAAGMIGPVVEWQEQLQSLLGHLSPWLVISLFYLVLLLLLPLMTVSTATILSRRWGRLTVSAWEVATRYSYALVPLGFGMWLAHYSFHFLTSYDTVVPTAQRFAADLGWNFLGDPEWARTCCRPAAKWLPRLEILFLDLGLLLSLYTGYRIALAQSPRLSQALKALAPWALLIVLLFAAGVWIVLQPMQMRGTMLGAG